MQDINQILRSLKSLVGPFPRFLIEELPESPVDLFLQWFHTAIEKGILEPHAMTLSTVDADGAPDARILILKNVLHDQWYFASSSESRKGQHIKYNPKVALTFYWSEIGRQVRIRGVASAIKIEASTQDFLRRSEDARALALIGRQSQELIDLNDLEEAFLQKKKLVKQQPQTMAPNWKLYSVLADEVEFWQGDPKRKHIRVRYNRKGEQWHHCFLWP